MSYMEIGFCDRSQYDEGLSTRVTEDQLLLDSMYTAILKMKTTDGEYVPGRDAFKLPAKLLNKEKPRH